MIIEYTASKDDVVRKFLEGVSFRNKKVEIADACLYLHGYPAVWFNNQGLVDYDNSFEQYDLVYAGLAIRYVNGPEAYKQFCARECVELVAISTSHMSTSISKTERKERFRLIKKGA